MALLLAVFTRSRRWPPSQVPVVTEPPILPFRAFAAPPAGDPTELQVQIQGYHKKRVNKIPHNSVQFEALLLSSHVRSVLTSCSNSQFGITLWLGPAVPL